MSLKFLILTALVVWAVPGAVLAQEPGEPTTAPLERHVLIIPPGFKVITVQQRTAVVEPADEAWVSQALQELAPTTRPTTMPSDLLDRLRAQRQQLAQRLTADLAIADQAVVEKFLDEKLQPMLSRLEQLDPPLFYLVTTRQRLKQLLLDGWSDPRFHYNRVADEVQFRPLVQLSTGREADDVVLPVIYRPEDSIEARSRTLAELVRQNEFHLARSISTRAMIQTQIAFADFVASEALGPLNLKEDQRWLGVGLAGILSSHYLAELSGMHAEEIIQMITRDDPRNRIRPATIDLLHPVAASQMRREAIAPYYDAYRRKSARVVKLWIERAGMATVPRTLLALRDNPPADGQSLLKQIQQLSGVDLSQEVVSGD